MTSSLTFVPKQTAVLCMDCQAGLVSIYAGNQNEFLPKAVNVLDGARRSGMTVIYVKVGFRPNLPEVSSRNSFFRSIKSSPKHQQLFSGQTGEIHPTLEPKENDIVVNKHRINAFAGTDLGMILRAQEIDTLVLFGISTSGVVLSTLLDACDSDYQLFVIKDCCADLDQTVHDCLIDKFFPTRATVLSADEFIKVLP